MIVVHSQPFVWCCGESLGDENPLLQRHAAYYSEFSE